MTEAERRIARDAAADTAGTEAAKMVADAFDRLACRLTNDRVERAGGLIGLALREEYARLREEIYQLAYRAEERRFEHLPSRHRHGAMINGYVAAFDPCDIGYVVTVPSLPGCVAQGDTLDEAKANAEEAIRCHLEGLAIDVVKP